MSDTASATITATQLDPTHWRYDLTLTDTGSTTVGTFWFSWIPGQDYLATQPSGITDPAGWSHVITGGGATDGFAIRWVAASASADLASGGTLSGFSFTSSDSPASVFGNSVFFPTTPVLTSFVYSGTPFSDAGFEFQVAEVACFLPGTLILTDRGEVAVQNLAVGDTIAMWRGGWRRLCWIGRGRALATRGRRGVATPVIVRKGALGDNIPHRDLHVTKGHSLWLDDVLIPVEFLVNHRSILWDDRAREVTVYHLELDAHDVLVANGAPAESYRDDGNRWLFQNAGAAVDRPVAAACAPVLTGGAVVDAVWRRLLDRAGARPGLPLTEDADVHLLVDGVRVNPERSGGDCLVFALAAGANQVRLVSRAGIPQELGLARDSRSLGVAVRRIVLRQGMRFRTIRASDERLRTGFHGFEADLGVRWTDGDALLPRELFAGFGGSLEVMVFAGGTARYVAAAGGVSDAA